MKYKFNSVELELKDLAEIIVKNFANKPYFSTQSLHKRILKQYDLPTHSTIKTLVYKEMRTKTKYMLHENLKTPLNILRSAGTISLVEVKKNCHGVTTNRLFKVNFEGLELPKCEDFNKEVEALVK